MCKAEDSFEFPWPVDVDTAWQAMNSQVLLNTLIPSDIDLAFRGLTDYGTVIKGTEIDAEVHFEPLYDDMNKTKIGRLALPGMRLIFGDHADLTLQVTRHEAVKHQTELHIIKGLHVGSVALGYELRKDRANPDATFMKTSLDVGGLGPVGFAAKPFLEYGLRRAGSYLVASKQEAA